MKANYNIPCMSTGEAARIAARITKKASAVEPWRLTRKNDVALKLLADRVAAERGYIIATDAHIFEEFADVCPVFRYSTPRDERAHIWAVYAGMQNYKGRVRMTIICVR